MTVTPHDLAQKWSDTPEATKADLIASVTPCTKPGYTKSSTDTTPVWIGDVAATTHLQNYEAYRAFGGPSGFSGTGTAVINSRTGEVLAKEAFRFDALLAQQAIEQAAAPEVI